MKWKYIQSSVLCDNHCELELNSVVGKLRGVFVLFTIDYVEWLLWDVMKVFSKELNRIYSTRILLNFAAKALIYNLFFFVSFTNR